MGAILQDISAYLDGYLRIKEVPDDVKALNGLQVENSGTIDRIVAAVDASQTTIDGAGKNALLIVHHGMLWDGHGAIIGRRHRKVVALYRNDTALYSAHIPLDLHPDVGNNVVLARRLGIGGYDWWGLHKGVPIGVAGAAPPALRSRDDLVPAVAKALNISDSDIKLIPGGPAELKRIGIITGGAGTAIAEAKAAGCDTYITGEGAAHTYFDAMELGVNVIYAGHYATETLGVQALAEHLSDRFKLPWEFHHHPTGL
jgi:dinuclear metal center YbgI/SA1388 family protein